MTADPPDAATFRAAVLQSLQQLADAQEKLRLEQAQNGRWLMRAHHQLQVQFQRSHLSIQQTLQLQHQLLLQMQQQYQQLHSAFGATRRDCHNDNSGAVSHHGEDHNDGDHCGQREERHGGGEAAGDTILAIGSSGIRESGGLESGRGREQCSGRQWRQGGDDSQTRVHEALRQTAPAPLLVSSMPESLHSLISEWLCHDMQRFIKADKNKWGSRPRNRFSVWKYLYLKVRKKELAMCHRGGQRADEEADRLLMAAKELDQERASLGMSMTQYLQHLKDNDHTVKRRKRFKR